MKPLSRKKRMTTLIIMVILFFILVPALWLYSSGYRLNDALSLVKTGGVYVHSDLANTRVYIDGDFVEDNGVLLKNTLIQNLRPNRDYKIRVEKDGYYTWEKELYVRPNLVTEGKILMLETSPDTREILQFLEDVDKNNATTTVANIEYLELIKYFDEAKGQFDIEVATTTTIQTSKGPVASSTLITEIELPEFIEDLKIKGLEEKIGLREKGKNLSWLEDGDVTVYWAGKDDSVPYYYCTNECNDSLVVSLGDDILKYDFYLDREDVIIALTKKGIFVVEIDNRSNQNIQPILESEGLDFRVIGGSILIFNGKNFVEIR
ncbi:MAG: hypothetical protein ACI9GH_000244 [Candidatus Paceibacteria bacterium]|jgi:hypothetical protein